MNKDERVTTMLNTNAKDMEYAAYNGIRSGTDRLLTNDEVRHRINLSRTWLHHAERSGRFPKAVAVGQRKFWRSSDVEKWIAAL